MLFSQLRFRFFALTRYSLKPGSRIEEAIEREKQIKGGSRKDKEILIKSINPAWKDLWQDIQDL